MSVGYLFRKPLKRSKTRILNTSEVCLKEKLHDRTSRWIEWKIETLPSTSYVKIRSIWFEKFAVGKCLKTSLLKVVTCDWFRLQIFQKILDLTPQYFLSLWNEKSTPLDPSLSLIEIWNVPIHTIVYSSLQSVLYRTVKTYSSKSSNLTL